MELGYHWLVLSCVGLVVSCWMLYKNLTSEETLGEMEAEVLIPFYEAFHRVNLWKVVRDEEVPAGNDLRIDIVALASKWDREFSRGDDVDSALRQIVTGRRR